MDYLNIHLIMINFDFLYKFILQFISYIDYSSYILSIFKIILPVSSLFNTLILYDIYFYFS